MGLLNFLGGAAGAGSDILQRERESAVRLQERNAGADYDAMLREKQVRTEAELRKQYEREKIAYENSPEYLSMTAATEETKATNALNTRGKLAPKAGEVAKAEFEAGAPTRKAAQAEKLDFSLAEARAKSAEDLRADIERMNDPKYLQGKAKEAAATRDPNSAALARVQLQAAQLALKEKEAEAKLPPAVKGSIAAIQKQADAISAAMTKAELEGTADPTAIKKYQDRLGDLNGQISKLYEPYLPEGSKPAAKDKPAGDMQDVRVGGKVIGKASTAEEAARLVAEFRKGGKAPAATAAPAPAAPPVDRLRDQPIGMLTPLATIEEAARAGNQKAIAYLQRRAQGMAENAAAPRSTADMLNR